MSLTDRAYDLIRQDIVRCALPPGAEFTETDLAERLQMSKTPVREALARLQFEGLVRAFPRRGYRIEPVRVSDINEIFDARIVLEAGVIGLAVQHITEEELDELERLAGASSDAFYVSDFDRAQQLNNVFHETIAKASRNARLYRMVGQTITEFDRFFYLEAQSDAPYPEDHVTHADIVAIMRKRDIPAAQAAIKTHIDSLRGVLIETLVRGAIGTAEFIQAG
jgi:DNA-binding GntR family transcriptional regulator